MSAAGLEVTTTDQSEWTWRDASMAAVYHVADSRIAGGRTQGWPHTRSTVRVSSTGRVDVWRASGWTYVADYTNPQAIDSSTGPDIAAAAHELIHGQPS